MTYIFLYIILIPLLFLLVRKNKKFESFPFVLLVGLMLLRYDSVSDYFAYVKIFDDIHRYGYTDSPVEPGWSFLIGQICNIPYSWFVLFGLCSCLPLFASYSLFKKYDIVLLGTALTFFLEYYFYYDNILRQCIALALFFFSIRYIENKQFFKFSILIVLGAFFHASSLVCFAFYPLIRYSYKADLSSFKIIAILLISYVLFLFSAIVSINDFLYDNIPILYFATDYEIIYEGVGVSYFLRACFASAPLLYFKNKKVDFMPILYVSFFSSVLTLFFSNIDVLRRLFMYLGIFEIIAISLLIKSLIATKKIQYVILMFAIMYVSWSKFVFDYFDNAYYYTCFSDNFKNELFYSRGGRAVLINEGLAEETDRNVFVKYPLKK